MLLVVLKIYDIVNIKLTKGANMPAAIKAENSIMLFNSTGLKNSAFQEILSRNLEIPTLDIELDGEIIKKIQQITKKLDVSPILNIGVENNNNIPPFLEEDLKNLKAEKIKVCFSFNHYGSEEDEKKLQWKSLLAYADHVFFANESDQQKAIDKGHVSQDKATYIQPTSHLVEAEILKRPPNILITGAPKRELLDQAAEAAKELGASTRIIVADTSLDAENITNLIMAKFALTEQDQRVGINLEVQELLKDTIKGPQKVEKYIKQLTEQFNIDEKSSQINPIDISLDSAPEDLQNIYKKARYTIPHAVDTNYNNGCIPLGHWNQADDIVAEINQRKNTPIIDTIHISEMHEELKKSEQQQLKTILQEMVVASRNMEANVSPPSTYPENDLRPESYLYRDEDILTLLKASVDVKTVSIYDYHGSGFLLSSTTIPAEYVESNIQALKKSVTKVIDDLEKGNKQAAIFPINTDGTHWVGLVVNKDKETGNIIFTYVNSLGTSIDKAPELKKLLGEKIQQLEGSGIHAEFKDLQLKQQHNTTDCGPWVVDNLEKIAKKEEILPFPDENIAGQRGIGLRRHHALLLAGIQGKAQATVVQAGQEGTGVNAIVKNLKKQQLSSSKPNPHFLRGSTTPLPKAGIVR